MGVVADKPPPTYPYGFPDDLVERLEAATGLREGAGAQMVVLSYLDIGSSTSHMR